MRIKDTINKVTKSKDGKALVENFASLSLLQVASYLFPFITLPYISNIVGVEYFGELATASAIIVYFQTIADWGFNFTATRDIAKNRDDMEKVSAIFSSVMWARILLALLSLVILFVLICFVPKFREIYVVLLLTFGIVIGHIMLPEWLFQGLEKMKYITVFSILSKLLFTVAVFIFIRERSDYILQPLLTSLGYIISGSISLYFIFVRFGIKLRKPSLPTIRTTIKKSTDVFVNTLMPNLYGSFSLILLSLYWGKAATGLLDAGWKFVIAGRQAQTVVGRTFFPFLSRRIDKHSMFAMFNILFSIIMVVGLFVFAPAIIHLFFPEEFNGAIPALRILSISLVFTALNITYGTNYLIVNGHDKILRKTTVIVSLIGFATSFPMIYLWGVIGAALNFTGTNMLMGLAVLWQARKNKKICHYDYCSNH